MLGIPPYPCCIEQAAQHVPLQHSCYARPQRYFSCYLRANNGRPPKNPLLIHTGIWRPRGRVIIDEGRGGEGRRGHAVRACPNVGALSRLGMWNQSRSCATYTLGHVEPVTPRTRGARVAACGWAPRDACGDARIASCAHRAMRASHHARMTCGMPWRDPVTCCCRDLLLSCRVMLSCRTCRDQAAPQVRGHQQRDQALPRCQALGRTHNRRVLRAGKRTVPSHALYESCLDRVMPCPSHALSESCPVRVMPCPSHVLSESCPVRVMP